MTRSWHVVPAAPLVLCAAPRRSSLHTLCSLLHARRALDPSSAKRVPPPSQELTRKTWSTSILFSNRCQSADEVESMLVTMFDNTAAAVEEGRIDVEAVTPEPEAELVARAQREQRRDHAPWHEAEDVRRDKFRSRDHRLRRVVRARRMAAYNRATARYIAASRQWTYD